MDEKTKKISVSTKEEEVDAMPTIEVVEYDRVAYVKEMEDYLRKLKAMPDAEAKKRSQINLESCHIIQEDGEFSERYRHSRREYQ